jgi:ABC-type Fe3+-hydroxamate transport system substrate-binding protein
MHFTKAFGALAVLAVVTLTACSSSSDSPAVSGSQTAPPASVSSSSSASAKPALPNEGRNFASCKDGHCQVDVRAGDQIPLPAAMGTRTATIVSITGGTATVQLASGTLITLNPGSTGSGLTTGDYEITFPTIEANRGVLQLDKA